MFPVAEPDSVMVRPTSKVKDNAEDYKTRDCDDFDRCKHEFSFTIGTYTSQASESALQPSVALKHGVGFR